MTSAPGEQPEITGACRSLRWGFHLYISTGGAIGAGVAATLKDLNPDEVQAAAALGALTGALSFFYTL